MQKMKAITLVLLLCGSSALGQNLMSFEMDAGAALPMHRNVSEVFNVGLNINLGFAFNVMQEKLYVKPYGGVNWYFKEIEDVNSVTEHMRTWKAGVETRYYYIKKEKWKLAPCLNINYNWSTNYYSSSSYNPFSNQTTNSTSDSYLEGTGISIALGLRVDIDNVYIKVDYEYFSPDVKVHQAILDEAASQGITVDPNPSLNLSSLNLTLGYILPIGKK